MKLAARNAIGSDARAHQNQAHASESHSANAFEAPPFNQGPNYNTDQIYIILISNLARLKEMASISFLS